MPQMSKVELYAAIRQAVVHDASAPVSSTAPARL